ncbi:MAG: ABC transporter permease [Firmicutes bacterium]|nr:ABC transporter permease [Bacillota bacterium]
MKNKKILIIQLLILIIFIITWQYLSDNKIINSFIFSSPKKILLSLYNLYVNNNLFIHIYTTIKEIIISFILGFIISFILAIILYLSNTLYKIVDPYLNVLNSLPKIALGPILIIILGANTKSIIIMALLINILVCFNSIYIGLISCNKYYLLLFKSYNATKIQTIKYLIIPNALINIVSALKINISMTLIGVIMGEFLVSKAGLGYLIIYGTQVFNLSLVYSSIILILIISYLIYIPIILIENKIKKISS